VRRTGGPALVTSRAAAPPLVLASGSPRRRQVLEQLGLAFEVVPPPESAERGWDGLEAPGDFAGGLAVAKARAVARERPGSLVVGADTIVVLDGEVLGKPSDSGEAAGMLRRLAGREHVVHTGLAVLAPGGADGGEASGVESTAVAIRRLSDAEIEAYVATGEPLDKAGAYGIQGLGAALVESVRGCYFNVMGFPVARFLALLGELGYAYAWPGTVLPRGGRAMTRS
jgi:septum formation protein